MDHFCIITNQDKDVNMKVTELVERHMKERGKVCVRAEHKQTCTDESCYTEITSVPDNTECVIVLGGDGTILHAAHELLDKTIPLLGINLGTLGFLAELEGYDFLKALDRLINDDYKLEPRMILRGTYMSKNFYALNDLVITRSGYSRLISLRVFVNDVKINDYIGDGIIISTPTGSTAYNLSAGGPVVTPESELIIITPICSHSLSARSIVLSAKDIVRIEVLQNKKALEDEAIATIDGQNMICMHVGDTIVIDKSEKLIQLVKLGEKDFFQVLQSKLGWGSLE